MQICFLLLLKTYFVQLYWNSLKYIPLWLLQQVNAYLANVAMKSFYNNYSVIKCYNYPDQSVLHLDGRATLTF